MTAGMRPQSRPGAVRRVPTTPTVQPVSAARNGGTAFMWLVAAIALGSALCLLVLNTLRSEQSFTLTTLQGRVAQLEDQQQALQSDISALSAPEAIAMKADAMGMVHASSVRFVQRSNGKLLGVSTSPQAGTSIAVNTLPQSAASAAASDVLAAGGIGTHVGNTSQQPSNSASSSPSNSALTRTLGQAASATKGQRLPEAKVRTSALGPSGSGPSRAALTPVKRYVVRHVPAQTKKK